MIAQEVQKYRKHKHYPRDGAEEFANVGHVRVWSLQSLILSRMRVQSTTVTRKDTSKRSRTTNIISTARDDAEESAVGHTLTNGCNILCLSRTRTPSTMVLAGGDIVESTMK